MSKFTTFIVAFECAMDPVVNGLGTFTHFLFGDTLKLDSPVRSYNTEYIADLIRGFVVSYGKDVTREKIIDLIIRKDLSNNDPFPDLISDPVKYVEYWGNFIVSRREAAEIEVDKFMDNMKLTKKKYKLYNFLIPDIDLDLRELILKADLFKNCLHIVIHHGG